MKYITDDLNKKLARVRNLAGEGIDLILDEVKTGGAEVLEGDEEDQRFDPAEYATSKLINIQHTMNILEKELSADFAYTFGHEDSVKEKLLAIKRDIIDTLCEGV
jgi:hypothetical protein